MPNDERDQQAHLQWIYDTQYRSIQRYFSEKFYIPSLTAGGMSTEQVDAEWSEHLRLLQENDDENKRMAEVRKERLSHEQELREADFMNTQIEEEAITKQQQDAAKAVVKAEIKRQPTFITKETLDAAILEALANPVGYDFAIDKQGKVYFDKALHPYALEPSAIPETSSNTEEVGLLDEKFKFEEKKLY